MSGGAVEWWRTVPGTAGAYDVSTEGRVRGWVEPLTGARQARPHVLTPFRVDGAVVVNLRVGTRSLRYRVARTVLVAHVGDPRPGQEAVHVDGDRDDCRLANLRWDYPERNPVRRAGSVEPELADLWATGEYPSLSALARASGRGVATVWRAVRRAA